MAAGRIPDLCIPPCDLLVKVDKLPTLGICKPDPRRAKQIAMERLESSSRPEDSVLDKLLHETCHDS